MDTPSLRQLDLFAQMVAAGNLTRCANDMGLPPEQIARDLASLEMRLGYRLFDDLEGAARLTPAGRKTAEAMTLLSEEGMRPHVDDRHVNSAVAACARAGRWREALQLLERLQLSDSAGEAGSGEGASPAARAT